MRIEERGARIEEGGAGSGELPQVLHSLDPRPPLLDPVFMARVRWRCRRGLLELDIVLGRFVEQHYAGLGIEQQAAFDTLLDMPDTELWDMIAGKTAPQEQCRIVLELIQAA